MGRRGSGRGGGRGKRRRVEPAEVVQGNERQIALDFSIEAKAEVFDSLADLQRRINVLDCERKAAANALRDLRKKKEVALNQAAAGKRSMTVEVEERPDFETGVVTTHRLDNGEQVSERSMTDGEKEAGVVLTGRGPVSRIGPQDAANLLGEVVAHVGGNGAAAPDEEEYPAPSTHPADVAAVVEAARV